MAKITPRDIINGLNEIIRDNKAGKRYSKDTVVWVSRARALINKQAAEIEDLKGQLAAEREVPEQGEEAQSDGPIDDPEGETE